MLGELLWKSDMASATFSVPSEEWVSFLRIGSVAAEPQSGYEGTEWNPEWEHRSVVKVSVKFDVSRRTFFP